MDSVPISYRIADASPHSGPHTPENILYDVPGDSSSRWSGAYQGHGKQWITLRLECLSILKSITLGKYKNRGSPWWSPPTLALKFLIDHPCNLKEFKIYVGLTEKCMTQALHGYVKNDTSPETFTLKHHNAAGCLFPTRYVKIIPLSAHGPSFNMSIWHVALSGIKDESYVQSISSSYDQYRERTVLRHILKHLRQRRLLTPYQLTHSRSGLEVEHPLLTDLHTKLVLQGDWAAAEALVHQISAEGLFDDYLRSRSPSPQWTRLDTAEGEKAPDGRGGHAMCIDTVKRVIYLHGGWSGTKCLDDFWSFDIEAGKWTQISASTSQDKNGPVARSCHKMAFDSKSGCIYLLGRLGNATSIRRSEETPTQHSQTNAPNGNGVHPDSASPCSEFYRYHTRGVDAGTWDLLTFDTATLGGPPLIYDSQMIMDEESQIIYVVGGRLVGPDKEPLYAGIFKYDVRASKWKALQAADGNMSCLRSGHSAVFDPGLGEIFIFSGQKDEKYLQDIITYNIRNNSIAELQTAFSGDKYREATFGQKAVIDSELKEIYTFGGLSRGVSGERSANRQIMDVCCWVYRYDTKPGRWVRSIMHRPPVSSTSKEVEEPLPRFAHEVVYDPKAKTMFMFGGNPGDPMDPDGNINGGPETELVKLEGTGVNLLRLDDFWKMTLVRPAKDGVIRRTIYQLRCQQFREMCESDDSIKALTFLQTQVHSVVDHTNPEEAKIFRSLLTHLLDAPSLMDVDDDDAARTTSLTRSSSQSSEHWTNKIEEERSQLETLKAVEDPIETKCGQELTAERFTQRNSVFEALLDFVDEGQKQPSGNLLDFVDIGEDL